MHLEKAKGTDSRMSAHIERTVHPKNADRTRTHLNRELVQFPEGVRNRTQAIAHRIETAGIRRKVGTNQVKAIRVLLTGSNKDMKQMEEDGQLDGWCNDSLQWLRETYGERNLVSAVLHMDEKTPHIHATIVPIVTGERRKAKKEEQNGKKKYRKKNTQDVRLCADDVMARHKLKHYQDTYAQAMSKYGLQRGIDGSLAKHISTMQYYKELVEQQDSLQENIETLLGLEEEAQKKLKKVKGEINVQKMKGAAAAPGARAHRQTTATPFLSSLKRITGPSPPSQTAAEGTLPRSYLIILDCAPKRKGKGEWVLFWTELWYNSR